MKDMIVDAAGLLGLTPEELLWVALSILATLTVTQAAKFLIKNIKVSYLPNLPSFIQTSTIAGFAFLFGLWLSTKALSGIHMHDHLVNNWSWTIAILSPVVFSLFLIWVQRQGWIRLEAYLKMRSIVMIDGKPELDKDTVQFMASDYDR